MGYVSWIGKYPTEESVIVTLLSKAGAVFYVKTSVPQALMICETINNIIGRTVNPRNKNLSPGGSSGGEGAIVGFRGGVIGVGTDLGKSNPISDGLRDSEYSQEVVFEFLRPLTFCTAYVPRMGDFRMQKWQSKCQKVCQIYADKCKLYGGARVGTQCLWTSDTLY